MVEEVAPGIRRLLAPNPGLMTGPGTNTYLVGSEEVAVVDPGPFSADHLGALRAAVGGGRIASVWLTHAHPDHATGVRALQEVTSARLAAWPTPNPTYAIPGLEAPELPLADGMPLTVDGQRFEVLYTPGHASDHVCFFRPADRVLFTGDVVVGRGTVVIAPPDGDMAVYLATLERLRALGASLMLPGHGDPIRDPAARVEEYVTHRREREAQVLDCVGRGLGAVAAIVACLYANVDARLHPVAAQQVLAHLLKLQAEGRVAEVDGRWRAWPPSAD